jgi:hypothetical protein
MADTRSPSQRIFNALQKVGVIDDTDRLLRVTLTAERGKLPILELVMKSDRDLAELAREMEAGTYIKMMEVIRS